MSLLEQIDQNLIAAIKSGDEVTRETLRMLKSAIKNRTIEENKTELNDEEIQNVISREAKKRRESIAAYERIGKTDLVAAEQKELDILEHYLPQQLNEAEVEKAVDAYLAAHPTTNAQIGQAMGVLSAELKGKADLGLVAKTLRQKVGM